MSEPSTTPVPAAAHASLEARAKALGSPIRWRILRLCLHEPRTNRELAELLGRNPATMLHHVRTLVDAGYLAPQEPRRGTRGAREIPYLATRLTWTEDEQTSSSDVLVRTFLEEIEGLRPDDVSIMRAGLRLSQDELHEYWRRTEEIVKDLMARREAEPDVERTSWGVFMAIHPDRQQDGPARED
ncbi:winged helix-turn-helix domain-containing protein [Agrococcus jejuensis]|uniref:Helix-turn-helix domain-containing protein n=1 Tax=Agrococcus jejuensis TaxID=399736 RepID=A0A1G8B6I6_9MICO|nr:winged helix-turn-helix domain-containing protein [Agrococcus jejuensis]SDH28778.1 Helix-turn-helix domain-containing protein [Agrococcus jejuensis]